MDPSEDNVDSSSSGSDQETLAASGETGAHQRLPAQSQDGPTLEGEARGPALESARSEQLLLSVPCSSQWRSPSGLTAQDIVDDYRRSRASSTEDRTTDPTAAAGLTSKPLSQARSDSEIELAAMRLGAIKATHTRAASEGHPLDPVAAARAAASITMDDLHKRQAASTSQSTLHASEHSGVASAGAECSHRGSEHAAAEAANGSDVWRRFCNSKFMCRFCAVFVIVLSVGGIVAFAFAVYFWNSKQESPAGSTNYRTARPPPKDDSDGESHSRKKLHL